jgi:hypothetical protein
MKYTLHGPFELPENAKKKVDLSPAQIVAFWKAANKSEREMLSDATGLFFFMFRAGRGIKPWYIGRAEKGSFEEETFTEERKAAYLKIARSRDRGTPLLVFIARRNEDGTFTQPGKVKHDDMTFVESYLIGLAMDKNADLLNVKENPMLQQLEVSGLINTTKGKPSIAVQELKKALR